MDLKTKNVKVAAYLRVSTDEQADKSGLGTQLRFIQNFVEMHKSQGWVLEPRFIYKDDGYSGTLAARPALDRMMHDANFLEEIKKLHTEFIYMVRDIMQRGRTPKYLFRSIANSIADAHNYILLCDRIYIPVQFQERLMKLLNEQQQKFNQFEDANKIKEQPEEQSKENKARQD